MPPENSLSRRVKRERQTLLAMVQLYCRDNHNGQPDLCVECQALADYALQRVERCPFKDQKPVCAKCVVHCYQPEMRTQVRTVMRYAGPRMLCKHPGMALMHGFDSIRYKPRTLKKSNPKT